MSTMTCAGRHPQAVSLNECQHTLSGQCMERFRIVGDSFAPCQESGWKTEAIISITRGEGVHNSVELANSGARVLCREGPGQGE